MKIQVHDISFLDYVNLRDKSAYNYYLQYAKIPGKDLFRIGDLFDQSFGSVKDIQDYLNFEGLTWEKFIDEISKLKKLSKKQVVKHTLFELQAVRVWLRDQIIYINNIESEVLGHASSSEEQQAGIEKFSKYRAFIQFDTLAGGDVTKYEVIRALPYSTCFAKLSLEADKKEYERNLNEILKRKK